LLTVMCVSPDIDLHGSGADACAGVDCGAGTCLGVNDRPTCQCDDDTVAVLTPGATTPTCVLRVGDVIEPSQIVWRERLAPNDDSADSGDADEADSDSHDAGYVFWPGCSFPRGDRVGGTLSLALLMFAGYVPRALRRRAKNQGAA
jgi:hypothetical protein